MMIRDQKGGFEYWAKWVDFVEAVKISNLQQISKPSGNPRYRPQFVYMTSNQCYEQMLRRYSKGEAIATLGEDFGLLIALWEQAEELGRGVWTAEMQQMRNSWAKNLDHYIGCFWIVGLALALEIPDTLWGRLLVLIGNEGEDELLDRVIAVRQPNRRIGKALCHPRPYRRLLAAITAHTGEEAAILLADFVEHWYLELNRLPEKGKPREVAMYDRPYWYEYGNENFEGGAYFGRWCVEAVAAVKAFGLDDSSCLGHPAYPGDLLRPNGPSTHVTSALPVAFESVSDSEPRKSWLNRLFRK